MDTDVLVAGAGPIGLTTAIELRRRGISCRIVDPLDEPRQYAKAVGIQPRTLELFENMGVLRQALDASTLMRGQIMYTNGVEVARVDLTLPRTFLTGSSASPSTRRSASSPSASPSWGQPSNAESVSPHSNNPTAPSPAHSATAAP
ncbi:hypothetical protein G9444_0886 [Rhodococcus erythropolis]|uniref:FAD-binding domain-containing protein n=1 Tax=Rhodococcus erythropolis TaxID=1833 RepID=A0A6G9CMU3_RHOER|nr:hypothetical protein G9444_0886 [Rhodococcus erythropolis]